MSPVVSAVMPTFRDAGLVERSLPKLLSGTSRELEVVVVNSDREQSERLRALVERLGDTRVRMMDLERPSGFAAAVNRGISVTSGPFVALVNSDLLVAEGYLDVLTRFLERRPRAGCAVGKLLRYDAEADRETGVIDSAGHAIGRNRRVVDRGENQEDAGQYDREEEVFGVSGAALVARREGLESVAIRGAYLDESFHMYKEDVDLSWRLRLAGWECWYVPSAVAYHARTGRGLAGTGYLHGFREFQRHERRKPLHVRMSSMRNQWLLLVKNEDPGNLLRDLPRVLGREALVLGHNLLDAPGPTASAVRQFARALPGALAARRAAGTRRRASASEIRRWFDT